jgi:prenylcysteine oxidase / farnesylcysteine lyase
MEKEKFNNRIINQLASIATLANYGQSVDINGFVGLVSLAGSTGDLWSIKEGNKAVPIKLIEKSGAIIKFNTKVKLVKKDSEQPDSKNLVVYETDNQAEICDNSFDYVIVSFPIYDLVNKNDFYLDFDSYNELIKYKMQLTNTYIIHGKVKLFSNLPNNKRLELYSTCPDIPYRCVGYQIPCDYSNKKDKDLYVKEEKKLYKIFSEDELGANEFDKIFESDYELIKSVPWRAYPKYENSIKAMPQIILDSESRQRVFYTNSLEWSSSCMEICCISSRNVALLIANREKHLVKKGKKKIFKENRWKIFEFFDDKIHSISRFFTAASILIFLLAMYFRS